MLSSRTLQMNYHKTQRLNLRQWRAEDYPLFAELTADPLVMQYFPSTLNRASSDALVDRLRDSIDDKGWGFWAAEIKETAEFIGFIGINQPAQTLPFSPCVEIGWRLARQFWGKGYASEGARACLKFAFENLALREIVSMTPVLNYPSEKVMQCIGMRDTEQNFNYPDLPEGHKLAGHVLYKITAEHWRRRQP
jgi:RimJ/RimL family protein N-acetyltransferase